MTRSHRIVSMDIKYQTGVVSKSDKKSLHLLIIHMCSIEDQRRRSTKAATLGLMAFKHTEKHVLEEEYPCEERGPLLEFGSTIYVANSNIGF